MRILDASDNEVIDPDLETGYLASEPLYIDHPATEEIPEIREEVTVWQNPQDPTNKIVQKMVVQKHVAARPAWREPVEYIQRYIPYTPEELAAREREREEMEAAAAEAAAKQAVMDALPDAFDELAEQTADSAMTIEVVCSAVEELAEMVASQSQNGGE